MKTSYLGLPFTKDDINHSRSITVYASKQNI